MRRNRAEIVQFVVIILISLLIFSCGVKGAPVPPGHSQGPKR